MRELPVLPACFYSSGVMWCLWVIWYWWWVIFSCYRSTSSSSKQRSAFSRSAADSSTTGLQQQTLTQRKGVRDPPQIKVAFFLLDEPIPYSTTVPGAEITLAKFKELITKKGTYRYQQLKFTTTSSLYCSIYNAYCTAITCVQCQYPCCIGLLVFKRITL